MNKKAIWLIVGLMSIALVGIILMQAYWINYSIKLNEAQFDKNVRLAIDNVSKVLERQEKDAFAYDLFLPDRNNFMMYEEIFLHFNDDPKAEIEFSFYKELSTDSFPDVWSNVARNLVSMDVDELNRSSEETYRQLRERINRTLQNQQSIARRIDTIQLNKLLAEELDIKGIDLPYKYGVFSRHYRNFVYTNFKEANPNVRAKSVNTNLKSANSNYIEELRNSDYRVNLFPETSMITGKMDSPGFLILFFPTRTKFLWSSAWLMLLGSILFTAIILFCFYYTIRVIFEQKKLSEIKSDFLNNMTHEFKTPIATISLAADSITSPIISGSAEKVKRFATIIKEENKRMNSQVEKVLQMALLDKQEYKMKFKSVDVNEIIEKAAKNISLQIEKKAGVLHTQLDANSPLIEADETHFTNVVHNLLDNANKYSPESPEITISTKDVNNGIEISVKDKGIGMNKEARKHIFDKFYRVSTGNLHDVKGFGLGLSYVKAILTAHKGQISVKSEEGKGSEFILFFPYRVNIIA